MITEFNGRPEEKRSILCAESDIERDDWVFYLARQIELARMSDSKEIDQALKASPVQIKMNPSRHEDTEKFKTSVQSTPKALTISMQVPQTLAVSSNRLDFGLGSDRSSMVVGSNVFGARLEDAIEFKRVKQNYDLPAIVYRCIEYLDAHKAWLEEGIYRLSGKSADIKYLRDRFEKGKLCIKN
jgi:hypothetical protein